MSTANTCLRRRVNLIPWSAHFCSATAAHRHLLELLQFFKLSLILPAVVVHLLANRDQVPQALLILRPRLMNIFIKLERGVVGAHPSVAAGDHEQPLDLVRLDLGSPEVQRNLLKF